MPNTQVSSQTQRIIVNPATYSVSVINAGPMGPTGPVSTVPGPEGPQGDQGIQGIQGETGPSEAASVLTVDGQILTRTGGVLTPITRANLAADAAFLYFSTRNRNLIDNGAMNVCQRATSKTLINSVPGIRVTDRWYMSLSGGPVWTISNIADAPVATGLTRSQKWLCTTAAASPAAGLYVMHQQGIEGRNLQHLLWGTASAKSIKLSFWVKSNKTGTYVAELTIAGSFYSYSYSVNAVDTWEFKSMTYPGHTSIAIPDSTTAGMTLHFWLGVGTTYGGGSVSNFWETVNNQRAVDQVNVASAVNNYWQITGVQLEVGSLVSPFEILRYDDELRKAQRYLNASPLGDLFPTIAQGVLQTTTKSEILVLHKVSMRAPPSPSYVGNLRIYDSAGGAASAVSAIADQGSGQTTIDMSFLNVTSGALTATRHVFLQGNNDASAQLLLSSEI